LFRGPGRERRRRDEVPRILDSGRGYAPRPRPLDAPAHRPVRRRDPAAPVAVEQERRVRLADDRDVWRWVERAGLEPLVEVAEEEDAVVVVAAQLGVEQDVGRLDRIVMGHADRGEHHLHARPQPGDIDISVLGRRVRRRHRRPLPIARYGPSGL